MYQWRFIKSIINPRNWLLLLYVLVNDFFVFGIGYVIGLLLGKTNNVETVKMIGTFEYPIFFALIFLLVNIVFTFFLTSSIGETIILKLSFSRKRLKKIKPGLSQETDRLLRLFDEVHDRALQEDSFCPKKMRIYYNDSQELNACIIGISTLVVNSQIMQMNDEEIKGIISHELGHSVNADSLLSLAKYTSNSIVTIFVYIFAQLLFISSFIVSGSDERNNLFSIIFRIFFAYLLRYIILSIYSVWLFIGHLCEMVTSRSHEYKADNFSIKLGYSKGLISALRKIDSSPKQKKSFTEGMLNSHPYTMDRIQRLQNDSNIFAPKNEYQLNRKG